MDYNLNDFIGRSFIPAPKPAIDALDTGKKPAEWVEILASKGISITERNLRERANRIGARIKLGRTMLITVGHIEMILKDSSQCPSNRTSVPANGGPKAVSNTTAKPSQTITNAALERLQKKLPGTGAVRKKKHA